MENTFAQNSYTDANLSMEKCSLKYRGSVTRIDNNHCGTLKCLSVDYTRQAAAESSYQKKCYVLFKTRAAVFYRV